MGSKRQLAQGSLEPRCFSPRRLELRREQQTSRPGAQPAPSWAEILGLARCCRGLLETRRASGRSSFFAVSPRTGSRLSQVVSAKTQLRGTRLRRILLAMRRGRRVFPLLITLAIGIGIGIVIAVTLLGHGKVKNIASVPVELSVLPQPSRPLPAYALRLDRSRWHRCGRVRACIDQRRLDTHRQQCLRLRSRAYGRSLHRVWSRRSVTSYPGPATPTRTVTTPSG